MTDLDSDLRRISIRVSDIEASAKGGRPPSIPEVEYVCNSFRDLLKLYFAQQTMIEKCGDEIKVLQALTQKPQSRWRELLARMRWV